MLSTGCNFGLKQCKECALKDKVYINKYCLGNKGTRESNIQTEKREQSSRRTL